jgi:hypothetical protein
MAELSRVVFTFDDGTERTLEGEELGYWVVTCLLASDYLLPVHAKAELGTRLGGLVRGFIT